METLILLVLILFASRIAEELAERTGNPAILGDIIAGIILGPSIMKIIPESNETLEFIGMIGVTLIMVLAGVEVNLRETKKITHSASIVAIFGVVAPIAFGIFTGRLFGMTIFESVLIGISLSITASAVSAEILENMKMIRTKIGETLIVAGVFDDIIGLMSITLLVIISQQTLTGASILLLLARITLFFILSWLVGYHIYPRLIDHAGTMRSSEARFAAAMILILAFSAFAEYVGISSIIGAFAAGLSLNHYMKKKEKYGFEEDIRSVSEGFMAPVFFVILGASIDITIINSNMTFIAILTIAAITSKTIGCAFGASLTGHTAKESLAIGYGMAARGAVTLIVAHMAQQISATDYTLIPHINIIHAGIITSVILVDLITIPLMRKKLNHHNKIPK